MQADRLDVFISHAGGDRAWAEWVDFVLRKELGLSTMCDVYDFAVGDNFVLRMNDALARAERLVLLLSPQSVGRRFVEAEWSAAFARSGGRLVPIVVEKVPVPPLLAATLYADLVGKDRPAAIAELRRALLGVQRPTREPPLPGARPPAGPDTPAFPGNAAQATRCGLRDGALWIPPGSVTLGIDAAEAKRLDGRIPSVDIRFQRPRHAVGVAGFYLARYPTTNAEYWRFVEAVGYEVPWGGGTLGEREAWSPLTRSFPDGLDDHPVVAVSWFDALAYCRWAGGRLPTEAEWERAARGETVRRWPFGDEWLSGAANTLEAGSAGTVPVDTSSPAGDSVLGVADLAGNVWEWCSTLRRAYPYECGDGREADDARGPRVIRGGDWASDRWSATCAMRRANAPTDRGATIGFRVAFDGPPP
ncbi:MAG: SUMF1/EgtB/PvdO family nonheme iron enzyme [Acidobacteria bacterium]|nr:SUMF1/EgtB/PvdO family nonheme iron enzyme [Acidobacteriota bacterium]